MENTHHSLIVGKHYPSIDGLRGLAALLVIWFHASYFVTIGMEEPLQGVSLAYYIVSSMGRTGVDLFFVLSGFLITGILIDTRNQKSNFKKFYIRRMLRIFPLYYGILFIFLAYFLFIFGLDAANGGLDHGKIAMHLLYFQNWMFNHNEDQFMLIEHTWSLAVEEQFYLIWPLVFLSLYKKDKPYKAVIVCLVMVVLSWALRLYLGTYGAYKILYTLTPARLDELALGALFSILCAQKASCLEGLRKVSPFIITICLTVITVILFTIAMQKDGNIHGAQDVYNLIFFSVLYTCLLAYIFLSSSANIFKRFFSTTPMRTVGKVSYGMYMFHGPLMMLIARWLHHNYDLGYWPMHLIMLLAGGGGSFVLAYLSYHYYEKRFLRLKDKWAPLDGK